MERTHHQFKAITLVFLTHTHTYTLIISHHRWKTEKKSQDADAGVARSAVEWVGIWEREFFVVEDGVSAGFSKEGRLENLWSAPSHSGTIFLENSREKREKSIINYYTFSNAKRGEVWEWHLIFSEGGWSSACVVMMDGKTRKIASPEKESINYVCLLFSPFFSSILIFSLCWKRKLIAKVSSIINKLMRIYWMQGIRKFLCV